jgi:hypothetical protein
MRAKELLCSHSPTIADPGEQRRRLFVKAASDHWLVSTRQRKGLEGGPEPSRTLFFVTDAAHDDAVVQWTEFHSFRKPIDLSMLASGESPSFGSGFTRRA